MSASEHTQRCRRMIEEQLEQLAGLRNANPRDAGFKMWRQNTLTVLQRVWPGDSARTEPFRRIVFTPPHARADGQTLRDWFSRGCSEASDCLVALIARIDRDGVPDGSESKGGRTQPLARGNDYDVPMLDLPPGSSSANLGPVLDQRSAMAEANAMPGTGTSREAGSPAPPQLKVELKTPTGEPAPLQIESQPRRPEPVPQPPAAATPPATPVAPAKPAATPAKPARARKTVARMRPRLKDMLGLGALDDDGTEPERRQQPERRHTGERRKEAARPAPPLAPEPEPEAPELQMDDATLARAADDFMRNSPVLGLQGKPVQRASDDTGFQEPDAIAVATLAADAGRLGVPEALREVVREQLMEIAGQIESNQPKWTSMQGGTQMAMEFPELARRLLPILLPWLERAA